MRASPNTTALFHQLDLCSLFLRTRFNRASTFLHPDLNEWQCYAWAKTAGINKSQRERRLLIKLSPYDRIFGFPVSSFLWLGRRSIRRKGTTEAKETMASLRLFYILIKSPVFFHLFHVLSAFPPSSVLFPTFNDRAYFATRDNNIGWPHENQLFNVLKTSIPHRTIWTNLTDFKTMGTYELTYHHCSNNWTILM